MPYNFHNAMRRCGICSEPGHRRETCGRGPRVEETLEELAKTHPARERRTFATYNAERRKKAVESLRRFHAQNRDLTKNVEDDVRQQIIDLAADEWSPGEIAHDLKLSVAVVAQVIRKHKAEAPPAPPRQPLTVWQFERVIEGKSRFYTSQEVALLNGFDLREVNAAWSSTHYGYYLAHREKK